MKIIDGDSHFMEPLDLFEQFLEPAYRERAMRLEKDPATGIQRFVVDGKPMQMLDFDELLGAAVAYGQKEAGRDLGTFDRYLIFSVEWQDMDKRVRFLEEEGIDKQVIYPRFGLSARRGVCASGTEDPRTALQFTCCLSGEDSG